MGGSQPRAAQPPGAAQPCPDAKPVSDDDPLRYRIIGGVQGYIAVRTTLVEVILKGGYRCKSRSNVPISFDPLLAVQGLRRYEADESQTVLEVFGIPEEKIHRHDDRSSGGYIEGQHLHAANLRLGTFKERGVKDYIGTPCPICGKIIDDVAAARGAVGNYQFYEGAFMVVPCPNDGCRQGQLERQERLKKGPHLWLYHVTSEAYAKLIKGAGGKMLRGSDGCAGGGIYFGLSPADCCRKALHGSDRGAGKLTGALLKCRVKVGDVVDEDKCKKWSFAELIRQKKDCVWGKLVYETKSYIVYSWDQVSVVARVDEQDNIIE